MDVGDKSYPNKPCHETFVVSWLILCRCKTDILFNFSRDRTGIAGSEKFGSIEVLSCSY